MNQLVALLLLAGLLQEATLPATAAVAVSAAPGADALGKQQTVQLQRQQRQGPSYVVQQLLGRKAGNYVQRILLPSAPIPLDTTEQPRTSSDTSSTSTSSSTTTTDSSSGSSSSSDDESTAVPVELDGSLADEIASQLDKDALANAAAASSSDSNSSGEVWEPAGSTSRDVLLQLLRPNLGSNTPPDQGGNDGSSSSSSSSSSGSPNTGADGESPPAAADTAAALAADAVTTARDNANADTLMRGTTDASSVQLQPQPGSNASNSSSGSEQPDASQQQEQQPQQDTDSSACSNSSSNTSTPGDTCQAHTAAAAPNRSPLEVLLTAVANRWQETQQFASSSGDGGMAGGGSIGDVRAAWQELMGELQKQQPELVSCKLLLSLPNKSGCCVWLLCYCSGVVEWHADGGAAEATA
jgi:hypothetical protein